MNVNIDFYGYSVDIDPADVADNLDKDASKDEIEREVAEAISNALMDAFPQYMHDGEDVVEAVAAILAKRDE